MATVIHVRCYLESLANGGKVAAPVNDGYCQCFDCKELRKHNPQMWDRIKTIITKEDNNATPE